MTKVIGDIDEVRRNPLKLRDLETKLKRKVNGGDLDPLENLFIGLDT